MKINLSSTQSATSIIEVLIAAGLISAVLTAMASSMIYTQRTIYDARERAHALDQAESCLNRFRAKRDVSTWADFCTAMDAGVRDDLTQAGGECLNIVTAGSEASQVGACGDELTGADAGLTVQITSSFEDFRGETRYVRVEETFYRHNYETKYSL